MGHPIVIGCGFGDEGKGKVTDYLSQNTYQPLVIRFSGGQQAGHHVVCNGVKHIFSSFGSGTVSGADTYWSKFCTISPTRLLNEMDILHDKNIRPKIYVDNKCPITTPCDVESNRKGRAMSDGTCGAGIGATINREENHYHLQVRDVYNRHIFNEKFEMIKKFYNVEENNEKINDFLYDCIAFAAHSDIIPVDGIPKEYCNYIFEGSQGLMLDQDIGFFPHVTRSNTGTKNALELLPNNDKELDVYLVTRAYQTRHGNGYMSNADKPHNIADNPDETNHTNSFQGEFRKGLLDVSMLKYAMDSDDYIREHRKTLVITCLDHIDNEYRFTWKDKIIVCNDEMSFVKEIQRRLEVNTVYLSRSSETSDMQKIM